MTAVVLIAAASDICWDDAVKLTLAIHDAQRVEQWRVTALDEAPIAPAVFEPRITTGRRAT